MSNVKEQAAVVANLFTGTLGFPGPLALYPGQMGRQVFTKDSTNAHTANKTLTSNSRRLARAAILDLAPPLGGRELMLYSVGVRELAPLLQPPEIVTPDGQ